METWPCDRYLLCHCNNNIRGRMQSVFSDVSCTRRSVRELHSGQTVTHPRNPEWLRHIGTAVHAKPPGRAAVQDNLSGTHGALVSAPYKNWHRCQNDASLRVWTLSVALQLTQSSIKIDTSHSVYTRFDPHAPRCIA